jgi:hypothetical protein
MPVPPSRRPRGLASDGELNVRVVIAVAVLATCTAGYLRQVLRTRAADASRAEAGTGAGSASVSMGCASEHGSVADGAARRVVDAQLRLGAVPMAAQLLH